VKNIHWVYLLHSIKGLAGSFIGIFIPIYFLKLGFSVQQIFIFWLIYSISLFFCSFLAAFLSKIIGFKPLVVLAMVVQFLVLYLLRILTFNQTSLIILSFCVGFQAAFYWLPINYLFATHSNQKQMGDNSGKLIAIPKIFRLPVPLISSFIIVYFGFNILFLISAIVYLIALYPLSRIPDIRVEFGFNPKTYFDLYAKYRRYFWAEFLENIREEVEGIILPIVIFLTIKSVISVGIISTLAPIGSIIFTYLVGKLSDKQNKTTLMRLGAITMVFIWLVRYFFPNSIVFYTASVIVGFLEALVLIPFTSIIYTNAKKENTLEFLLFRESSVGMARIFVYIIAIILALNINLTFLLPVASMALFMFY